MNKHKGNTQPAIDQEEHLRISNTDGKKVFIIDDNDNQITTFSNATVSLLGNVTIEVGTGVADLGALRAGAASATKTGIAVMAQHHTDSAHIAEGEDTWAALHLSDLGALETEPEQHHIFDEMDVTDGWAVLDDATANIALTSKHVVGIKAITFDKVNGSGGTSATIDKTISSTDLGEIAPHDIIQTIVYLPSLSNVLYVFIRIGTNDTNYNEWHIPAEALTAAIFETLVFDVGDADYDGITGNGIDWTAITYIAVGVEFDLESRSMSGIVFDELSYHTNQHVSAAINAEVTSSVSSANINLQKVGGSPTDKGTGNASNGSQRIVLANDQPIVETKITGNVTVEQGDDPWNTSLVGNVTLSDSKGFIGLVTVGNTIDTTFSGNVTLDPGSQTGIVGNVTLSDPKGFIGLVTIVGSLAPAAGNVTLDTPASFFHAVVSAASGQRTRFPSQASRWAIIQGNPDNSTLAYIGASGVSAVANGFPLSGGQMTGMEVRNLNEIFLANATGSTLASPFVSVNVTGAF